MTADTYSSDGVGLLLMGTGNDNNTWGANANTSIVQIAADAIANALTSAVTGGTLDLSGSPPPAASSQARYAALIFTGVLTSNQLIQIPNFTKFWWVKNSTSGSFTLKFKTSAGSASTAIPQNSGWQLVQCDGSNAIVVFPYNSIQTQMPDGSVSAPPHSFLNETGTGAYRAGTQDYRIAVNGIDVLQMTGSGASSPNLIAIASGQTLQVTTLLLDSTTAGAAAGPTLDLYREKAASVSDFIGNIDFNGKDSASNKQLYARFVAQITDPTSTTEDAIILLQQVIAGTLTTVLTSSNLALITALQLQTQDGTKTAPGYGFSGDTDTGMYRIGANNLGLSCGDTKIVDVTTSGASVTGGVTSSGALSGATAAGAMLATQAQMETATATNVLVAPGTQQYHPGMAKAWVRFTGASGAIAASHNVSGVVRNSAGHYTISFTTAFSSASYAVSATPYRSGADSFFCTVTNIAAGSVSVSNNFIDGSTPDPTAVFVVCFGDQA